MKALSKKQLSVLGQAARKAWRHLADGGMRPGDFAEWRQGFTFDQVQRASWHECDQRHFVPLLNAFRAVVGQAPVADRTPKDDEAALVWTLKDRVQHWELRPGYVAAVIADKCGRQWVTKDMTLERMVAGLTSRELRQLLFTLEARARAKARKEAAAAGLPAPVEVHTSRSTMPPARLAAARGDELAE